MRNMTMSELNEIRDVPTQRRGMATYATAILAAFIGGGSEACEVEPSDFGRTEGNMGKHTNTHMRRCLNDRIDELMIGDFVKAITARNRLFLVRAEQAPDLPPSIMFAMKSA